MKAVCIDDCAEVLEVLGSYLKLTGFDQVSLYSESHGISPENVFTDADIIICDISMPYVKGDEIYRQYRKMIREGSSNSKFFILTGSPMEALPMDSWAEISGADEILSKPLLFEDFVDIMNRHYLIKKAV